MHEYLIFCVNLCLLGCVIAQKNEVGAARAAALSAINEGTSSGIAGGETAEEVARVGAMATGEAAAMTAMTREGVEAAAAATGTAVVGSTIETDGAVTAAA